MNRISLLLIAAMVAFGAMAVSTSDYVIDEGTLTGDVNGDGHVSSVDITALYNYLLNGDNSNLVNGDQDGDGHISSVDVTVVYNVMLNGGGSSTGGSTIYMPQFYNAQSSGTTVPYSWQNDDVVILAVDNSESNRYVMKRVNGRWQLLDHPGSSKKGFVTSGGSVKAVYIQHCNTSTIVSPYQPITATGDVAFGSGSYTVSLKNNKLYVKLNMSLNHAVSRIDVTGAHAGDYFYETVDHVDGVSSILQSTVTTSTKAPVIDIDNNNVGHAYGKWRTGARVPSKLTLCFYRNSDAHGYTMNSTLSQLALGKSTTFNANTLSNQQRDTYFVSTTPDEADNAIVARAGITPHAKATVGTEFMLKVYDGANIASTGSVIAAYSSNDVVTVTNGTAYDGYRYVMILANKVGSAVVYIKYKLDTGTVLDYSVRVDVSPTLWVAGSIYSGNEYIPALWRNNKYQLYSGLGHSGYTDAHQVRAHGKYVYVVLHNNKEVNYSNANSNACDAAVYYCSGAHTGGYFNKYTDAITGDWNYRSYDGFNLYNYALPLVYVDGNRAVFHTSSARSSNTANASITTSIYKGRTLIGTINNFVPTAMAGITSSKKVIIAGYRSDGGWYNSSSIGYVVVIDYSGATPTIATYSRNSTLFESVCIKDGVVYLAATYINFSQDQYYPHLGNLFYKFDLTTKAFTLVAGDESQDHDNWRMKVVKGFSVYNNTFYFWADDRAAPINYSTGRSTMGYIAFNSQDPQFVNKATYSGVTYDMYAKGISVSDSGTLYGIFSMQEARNVSNKIKRIGYFDVPVDQITSIEPVNLVNASFSTTRIHDVFLQTSLDE